MLSYWTLTLATTFAAALGLTPLVRRMALRRQVVDLPDGRRKRHGRPVPLWGGMAVYGATAIGLTLLYFGAPSTEEFRDLAAAWLFAAGCVCLIGGIDDRYNLPARVKLALQIIAVLPIVLLGYYVDRVVVFSYPVELGALGVPLTVLWLVGCINALNLLDGMDGLAALIGLSTAALLGVIAVSEGHVHVSLMAFVLSAALAGFLLYNAPPASIFLGDSGSMVIGLSLGLLGIQGSLKTSATLAITAPVVVMTLPMLDVAAAIVRRGLTGRKLDTPDRLHIHHRLLSRGWSNWQVLCLLEALCLLTGAAATAATIFRRDALAWIVAMTLVVLMIRLRLFGHHEFALMKRTINRSIRQIVEFTGIAAAFPGREQTGHAADGISSPAVQALSKAATDFTSLERSTWEVFIEQLRGCGAQEMEFCLEQAGQLRRVRWIKPGAAPGEKCCWSIAVSLPMPEGARCNVRAAGCRPLRRLKQQEKITRLLKTFGNHFAAHAEKIFSPLSLPVVEGRTETMSDSRRKAA